MPKVVEIKPSHTPAELRRLAASGKDANQSRRLLSIAAALDSESARRLTPDRRRTVTPRTNC
jgi:pyrroline-5-carboxylate reductase